MLTYLYFLSIHEAKLKNDHSNDCDTIIKLRESIKIIYILIDEFSTLKSRGQIQRGFFRLTKHANINSAINKYPCYK